MTSGEIAVTSFYKFVSLGTRELEDLAAKIRGYGELLGLLGLVLIAPEGCNATVAGSSESVQTFKTFLTALPNFSDLTFKDSRSLRRPFRRFSVQLREEIVTTKRPPAVPAVDQRNRLTPVEWQQRLDQGRDDVVVLDVRNEYEVKLGRFRGAVDPGIKRFSDFAEYVRCSGISKESTVLMYCTGGIRCEKALGEMQEQGYPRVFQLDGGILKYLEEFPNRDFEGECFVFDHRVAVDQRLAPTTQFGLCPHCGDPGSERITCRRCGTETWVCAECRSGERGEVCSKNCAYHARRAERELRR